MEFNNFINGRRYTVGAELELRLLHEDLSLANEFDFIAQNLNEQYKDNIAPEYLKSLVEINTPVYDSPKELATYIKTCIEYLQTIASQKHLLLNTSGSYTLCNKNVQISEKERYEELHNEHQLLLEEFTICGFHTHVGFETFDDALKAYNFSIMYLPLFLALSASSVCYNNRYTGIDSYRTKIFDRLPKSSIPEYFDSYKQIKALYDLLEKTHVIKTQKDIWWDLRIQPDLQTLEFRICDAINDYERIEVIVALIQGLCRLSEVKSIEKMPLQVLKQNMWSATRYSMDGEFIFHEKMSIKTALQNLVNELDSYGFLPQESMDKIQTIIQKDSLAKEQKQVFAKTQSFEAVERLGVFK